jgi:hypothetical protein
MNFTYKTLLIALTFITITFTACKDGDPATPETPSVNFSIAEPVASTKFGKGDTVHINGMITWENELHGYELTVTNVTADSVVFTKHNHADGNTMHIHENWVNDVASHSDMSLTIDAFTDHDGAKETKVILFHCHPM